jgi:hypothetical protein
MKLQKADPTPIGRVPRLSDLKSLRSRASHLRKGMPQELGSDHFCSFITKVLLYLENCVMLQLQAR